MPPAGSASYYALQRCAPDVRASVAALIEYHVQVRDIADAVGDPQVAQAKLSWWAGQVDALRTARADHPVLRALGPRLAAAGAAPDALTGVVDSVRIDLAQNRWLDRAALLHYCERSCGQTLRASAALLGLRDAAALDAAQDLGVGLRQVAIVRNLGRDIGRGRIYVPLDAMRRHGVTAASLHRRAVDASIRALLADEARLARARLDAARAALAPYPTAQTAPLLAIGAMAQALLTEIEREEFAVLHQRIGLTPLRKLWISRSCTWRR